MSFVRIESNTALFTYVYLYTYLNFLLDCDSFIESDGSRMEYGR